MTQALSIRAAAREHGSAIGLRVGERAYTFDELAALTHERMRSLDRDVGDPRPLPVLGANTLATVLTLYALLERRVPALLVHPRLTPGERDTLLVAAAERGPLGTADACAVIHTSGTTGTPRAAILTRAAMEASALASEANLGWRDDDCWMLCMPLAHVGGLSILTRCLVARRCVALEAQFDVPHFIERMRAQRATLVSLVPTMLTRLLDEHPGWAGGGSLRAILLGGAAAAPSLVERATERRLPVLVTYGLTETCSQVTTTPYALRFASAAHGVGVPLPDIDVRVRDGRIEVRGPVVMQRYWDESPRAPDAWLDTGDLGEFDRDGFLHVHARRHDLIVTGGENVYPVEVENALVACPGVHAAAVFGLPDAVWGQAVAAVLVADRHIATVTRLRDYIERHLAGHKQPRHIVFAERLPQTRAGKLDRAALAGFASRLQPLRAAQDV